MAGFQVIPAVDIKGGKCVRLYQGRPEAETVFESDPVDSALKWQDQGAGLLHVVDLDGAFQGTPVNNEVISGLMERLSIPVQVGGGIRSTDTALSYIEAGAARVVVGTRAFSDADWLVDLADKLGDRLAVGVDVKEGRIATAGWLELSEIVPTLAVEKLAAGGVKRIIYTDVTRDGTLDGPDFDGIEEVASASPIPVIASGGVGTVDDVLRIYRMKGSGVEGVIVGMALYKGRFTLDEALGAIKGEAGL
ncbi:MAG: 1-(5-phosphoribosyl)-5-[(5-phosphoribosylamino)methylideneamino]imidazole-4-carboxamide isomerase [Actinobacteria bacterium]|nr:1-(5-phosphoribosyl)-5-[(5-phosphoribosylamino)methylideneamino]imidazole-4-carboxamide isomerase [Actinomycetota bacterium]